ncbi:hypothetical protein LO762_26345 [Actinocorallia sp. API 0066]|uniref:hypothetical protein n=1 Tax=Actinocorallia sp. API 0066 TaxID=2896846 RepID=UPI001E46B57E|nr:hypothetical protein [Actinocorallia sp. API 0066]MCD0452675.1 hypothetical protein [Actinocorallia sp. API 0066]
MDPAVAARRLCLAVDMENYSGRSDAEQASAQARLARLLDDAHAAASPSAPLARQASGDGEVALLDPPVDEARFVSDFVHSLWTGLRARNTPIRLRVAAHTGIAWVGANGFVGRAVVKTCRMLDSAPLRAALRSDEEARLALIVSDAFFDDVIRRDPPGLSSAAFTKTRTGPPEAEFSCDAWIWTGQTRRLLPEAAHTAPPPAPQAEPAAVVVAPVAAMSVTVHPGGVIGTLIQAGEIVGGFRVAPERPADTP